MIFGNNLQLHGNYTSPMTRHLNRPFPSSPQPPFQSEANCEVFVMNDQFLFILKLEVITITRISHLDSL